MGLTGIRPTSLLLIFGIALLVFGTNRVKSLGKDLATAIREFREGMAEGSQSNTDKQDKTE